MSTATQSVYPTRRRPPAVDLVPDELPELGSTSELLIRAELHALQATEEALRTGLPGIRARGLDPDPGLVASTGPIPY